MSGERERLITNAYNVVTGDGGVATPEEALDALNRLWDAAVVQVDEAKLAEVIRVELSKGDYMSRPGDLPYADSGRRAARAVAEYLRGER